MVFKLLLSAKKSWRRLNGSSHITEVIQVVGLEDGIKPIKRVAGSSHHQLSTGR